MEIAKRRKDVDGEEYVLEREAESNRGARAWFMVSALHRAKALDAVLVVVREDDPAALERATRVVEITAKLAHPALARVHATGREHGLPFQIVEDFRESRSLATLVLAHGPAHWQEAVLLTRALASALALVHEAGLVHAGLAPGLVFLDRSWRPKLALDATLLALAGQPGPRTPAVFREPEETGVPTAKGNLYSLGALLATLLTGHPHSSPAPRALVSEIPERLERLVLDLLAPAAEQRPASAAEVVARLDALA